MAKLLPSKNQQKQHRQAVRDDQQSIECSAMTPSRRPLGSAHSAIDLISDLFVDNCEVAGELLAFMDSHTIAALCTALRFSKLACHVLEDERRWLDLLRLQCGVVKAKCGNGYVWSKLAELETKDERSPSQLVVTPTVRAFGCDALVDFLSLRSQIQHLTQDVHVVKGDAKTITRVDEREVDLRVVPHDLAHYFALVPEAVDVCFFRIRYIEYMWTLRELAKNKSAKCVLITPPRTSGSVLLPDHEAKIALQAVRDTIVSCDFDKKIAFVVSDELVSRAYVDAHKELLADDQCYCAVASKDDLCF